MTATPGDKPSVQIEQRVARHRLVVGCANRELLQSISICRQP